MTLQKCLDLFRRTYISMLQTLDLFLDIPLFFQYLLVLRTAYHSTLCRFIDENQRLIRAERSGNGYTLLLSAGKLYRIISGLGL